MATSLLSPPIGVRKPPLLHSSKLSFASSAPVRRWRFNSPMASAKDPNSPMASSKDPNSPMASVKKDPNSSMASSKDPFNEGPTDDYENSFKYLYGLPPSHLNAIITKQKYARPQTEEGSSSYLDDLTKEISTGLPFSHLNTVITKQKDARPQTESVTEESVSYLANEEEVEKETISYPGNFANHYGLESASGMSESAPPRYIMNTTGEEQQSSVSFPLRRLPWRGRYKGKPLPRPPDMDSQFYFDRVIFLEDPIVPEVAELIIAQFLWLDSDDSSKPIYLYISSEGNEDEEGEVLASAEYAYAIADVMTGCKSKVYTIHMGVADGLAALLLSLGVKGRRGLQQHSITELYLPEVPGSSGKATDMWSMGKEVEESMKTFLELLSIGTGKPTEELYRDLQEPKFFDPQAAIAYGLADRIVGPQELGFGNAVKKIGGNPVLDAKKAEVDELRAMRRAQLAESKGKANPQAPAPSVA